MLLPPAKVIGTALRQMPAAIEQGFENVKKDLGIGCKTVSTTAAVKPVSSESTTSTKRNSAQPHSGNRAVT